MSKSHTYNLIVDRLKTRVDRFIAEKVDDISRSKIQQDIEAGLVTANGKIIIAGKQVVRDGDKIVYKYQAPKELEAKNIPIKTLYNNHGILIIDKPPGLAVHPGAGLKADSLVEALLYHFKDIKIVGEEDRPGIVHRLDKDTSGAMLVALTPEIYEYLKQAFLDRKVKKEYIALVRGRLQPSQGVINTPIGKSKTDFRKYATENILEAKPSITEYKVIEYIGGSAKDAEGNDLSLKFNGKRSGMASNTGVDEYTLIRVQLHTGRTHQIRVHLASLGFPLLGDPLYGVNSRAVKKGIKGLTRQFLHATSLGLTLPNGEEIEVQSKLPTDLREVLEKLKSKKLKQL